MNILGRGRYFALSFPLLVTHLTAIRNWGLLRLVSSSGILRRVRRRQSDSQRRIARATWIQMLADGGSAATWSSSATIQHRHNVETLVFRSEERALMLARCASSGHLQLHLEWRPERPVLPGLLLGSGYCCRS